MEIGYALSSEEHAPLDLVRNARRAEDAGFSFALISDHFHPWIDRQGHSPFVWAVIGGIATSTSTLRLGTGVTCPLIHMHPAIVAQAAATAAAMMPGRFFLGMGTGENLNEHVTGARWPSLRERREMLEEAVALLRLLWQGELCSWDGAHYDLDTRVSTPCPASPSRWWSRPAGRLRPSSPRASATASSPQRPRPACSTPTAGPAATARATGR